MRQLLLTTLLCLLLTSSASAKNMYIAGAAMSPGANGTFWTTDVRIFNPSSDETLNISVHFIPAGTDGRNISGQILSVGPRGTIVLDDAVAQLAPFFSGIGTIRLDSDTDRSYDFVASARTYNSSPDFSTPGTYGQFIPAEAAGNGSLHSVLLHVRSTPEFRTNLGALNTAQEPATVVFRLLRVDGVPLAATAPQQVPPMSMKQWSIHDLFGAVDMAHATVTVEASIPVVSWASVIDNVTGDPIYVRGENDSAGD